ncbi:MAG: PD40 domain-containing protein [Chloracidobacterium sp.]|nr:PD40 domain-containing protein [Chloracidobacterium sp.]MBL0241521.1 PD40 domain-containing protein [Chloracidobacterium sp.]
MTVRHLVLAFLMSVAFFSIAMAQGTRMLRHPAVSRDLVAFAYAGDIWTVSRSGGKALRLTATPGVETEPYFSPDGSKIAFTATVGGNTDVYVVATSGGDPKRMTYSPSEDHVRGWMPDGQRILFSSVRGNAPLESHWRLWTISVNGGMPEPLQLSRAFTGAYSGDGQRLAYEEFSTTMFPPWQETSFWRHYRGGRTHPISVINLADNSISKLPWTNSNDSSPMWIGNTIYFVSDRNFTANLFSYDTGSKQVKQVSNHNDFDVMTASAGSDAVVYEQAGYIHLVDAKTGKSQQLNIEVTGDFPWAQTQFKKVGDMIRSSALSPSGVRVAFEARGDIFTVPTGKGDYRNLTNSSGAHDRDPAWSPDGNQLAWFSDPTGEYQLMIGDASGLNAPRVIALPTTAYFQNPIWSPNGEQLVVEDNHSNLWTMDVKTGTFAKIDTDNDPVPSATFNASWSPDSKWITYSRNLNSRLSAIFVYSVDEKKTRQITDGLADAISPAFDAGGKYLYFLASTNFGPKTSWLDMSSIDHPTDRSAYLVVLPSDEPSPLIPETGDEPKPASPSDAPKGKPAAGATAVRIDFAGINNRILPLSVRAANLSSLNAGPVGTFFYTELVPEIGAFRLHKYTVAAGAAMPFMDGISQYSVSADGKKLIYAARGGRFGVVGTTAPAKPGEGALNTAQLEMKVDPRAEWANIFRETWRIQREYFYDEKMQGADWNAVYKKYLPLLASVQHRSDLGYLIAQTGGELTVGHSYLSGSGDVPSDNPVSVGLLGADIKVENGKYRLSRIYTGENWNPELRAPLSAPGIDAREGDYVLAVNGKPIDTSANFYSFFEGMANRQIVLRLNDQPTPEGSRLVTVVPIASENGIRTRGWVEDNRRLVDKLSGGRLAYVWLPNTGGPGYTSFVRYFYAQQNKEGTVVDERYNQGGMVADFIVNELDRKPMGSFAVRDGNTFFSPIAGVYGPKVMVINESAGSGGDALPFYFKLRKLGPLVGTRTWGGLVGTLGVPPTIDGGGITAPSLAFYNLEGKWDVENIGVSADINVENTPIENGKDAQLERAVAEAMKLLQTEPLKRTPRPAPIDRVSKP